MGSVQLRWERCLERHGPRGRGPGGVSGARFRAAR
jgi:hypothetical protein